MSGSGREALLDDWEWSRGPLNTLDHSGGPPDHSRTFGRAFRPLPDIRKSLPTTLGHLKGPSEHSRTFERASWTFGRASRPLPNICEASRTFSRVSRPLTDIRKGHSTTPGQLGGPSAHPGGPPDNCRTSRRASHPSETSGRVSRPFADLQDVLPSFRKGLPTTPGHTGGPPCNCRTSRRASRPLPDIRESLSTTPCNP